MHESPFALSGIADEAGKPIERQIAAHKELGWKYIELRNVDGTSIIDLPEERFEAVSAALADAGLSVSGLASPIANWSTRITDPFEKSVDPLRRAIPRLQHFRTPYIRVMSYPNNGLEQSAWGDESIRRMRELGKIAQDGGAILLVENCDGWACLSPRHYAEYFERVDSPAVKAVYDTGNPASHGHTNTWEWYQAARPHIAYVHIKAHTGPAGRHAWPDEGHSCVEETLRQLLETGYRGYVSIEPHIHDVAKKEASYAEAVAAGEDTAFRSYVEYGRRLSAVLAAATGAVA
ncbi:sugar phosphate isomerase/epimerase [Verrucomicrobia bacterium LW23]|nr:sugar phosphate isomerase/epimerase [Verrucomicrobia bacterium LW23]